MMRRLLLALAILGLPALVSAQNILGSQTITVQDSTCALQGSCATFIVQQGQSVTLGVTGIWIGILTLQVQTDGATWVTTEYTRLSSDARVTTTTSNGNFSITNTGITAVRVSGGTFTNGGAAVVTATTGSGSLSPSGTGGGGGGAVTIADGADVTLGVTTDAAVGDANGTVNAHLREVAKKLDASIAVTGSGNFTVVQPTGTNLHAVLDTTSTTAVTQATAANLNAAVVGTGTAGAAAGGVLTIQGVAAMTKLLVTPDSVALPANQSVNVAQMNGVTTTMGNGVAGTGVQRVAIASDNTAFSVNATLAAGTAQIGSVTTWAGGTLKQGGTAAMTGTTSTSVITGTASNNLYITGCRFSNTSVSVSTLVILQDGSGGTTLDTIPVPLGWGGAVVTYPSPLKVTTQGNGLFAQDVTTGASVIAFCNGWISTVSY